MEFVLSIIYPTFFVNIKKSSELADIVYIDRHPQLCKGVPDMNNEYFTEMHKLIERAKVLERAGREDDALKTYLEIHEKFFPNTSDLFERPAILLEKRKRFDEAIAMCEKAIKLINDGKVTGVKENFSRRIDRIKARSEHGGPAPRSSDALSKSESKVAQEKPKQEEIHTPKVKKEKVQREFVFIKGFVASLSQFVKQIAKLPGLILYLIKSFIIGLKKLDWRSILTLVIFIAMGFGIFYGLKYYDRSKYEVYLDMSEFESTGSAVGNPFEVPLEDLPPITNSMIETANKSISQMPGIKTSGIIVQKNVTGFVIMLNPGATQKEAKEAAEVYVRALSLAAAAENKELSGPNPLSYGSLYDYYGLLVVAGESPDNLILKGVKAPKSIGITWRK